LYFHRVKKIILIIAACVFYTYSFCQYTLRLIVNDVATKKTDDIYVAGDFNSWNPADANYKMKLFGASRKVFVFKDIAPGKYVFKFTRGNWDKVETTAKGEDVLNHEVEVQSDTSLSFSIAGWHDDYPDKPKPNTATASVHVVDTAFFIPQLNRHRRIWIYLPANYDVQKGKSYPVLYMQDGQNLFNERTAAFGEWGVDECLDTLERQMNKECIVVGIDNSDVNRLTEYNPYDQPKYGKGEGNQYADFLVKTLKPFIDQHYRTLKDASHTYIAGSSMGAVISLYAVIKYPDVFSAAGIFSPAFELTPQLYNDAKQVKWNGMHRFFFYAGGKESETMINNMKRMEGSFNSDNMIDTREVVFPLGQHNEKYWGMVFDDFYKWLLK
jgi:predicted alpha/beta superfamily hydrolase